MAGYKKKYDPNAPSSEDKALDVFAEMMIEKIESLSKGEAWKKPWFTEGTLQWPKNLSGREYNGMNALMLLMHCEKQGYTIPRFCTFDCVQRMNRRMSEGSAESSLSGNAERRGGSRNGNKAVKEGEDAKRVSVLKGEKSFPVMLTTFTCVDKETKAKIKYEDYKQLSEKEKEKYTIYPNLKVFRVFNVAQTNLQEARPELWAQLEQEYASPKENKGKQYAFEPMDVMIRDNRWICPIRPVKQDNAFYSISKNEIVVPTKAQFKDGEAFYGTAFHEMVHSTGAENQLGRIKPTSFGSDEYAREELVAELGSALIAQRYGMTKNVKEDSCAYLKSWLDSLKESPQFIKTTLMDVKKATSMVTQCVDKVAVELGKTQEQAQSVEETVKEQQPMFYSSVAYLQSTDDTSRFDALMQKGDYKTLLQEAAEYDTGDEIEHGKTFSSPHQNKNDDVLDENLRYAVVYNNSVGGTYDILRKVSEAEVRASIKRYGLASDATEDVKAVARAMVAEQFSKMAEHKMPVFSMENGEVLHLQYNSHTDRVDVGTPSNAGLIIDHVFPYDHNKSLDGNLQDIHEQLSEMEEYKQEETASCGLRR